MSTTWLASPSCASCWAVSSMAEKQNTPEIRFEGFTDPWEQRKLGELGFAQSGIGFPDAEQGGTEGTPFFKVSDMNTPGNEYELVASNNYVTAEQIARMGWRPINQVPAIFFAKVGAAVMLNRKRLVNEPFLLDNNTMAFSMDSSLLDTQFGRSLFERLDLTSLIQVGALPSFNSSDVESISVSLPSTMNEQRQIGQYLYDLNTLITLHQRKHDKLCTMKRSMLDKMFPKPGETEPEIRFKGFTDPWEQRKFADFVTASGIRNSENLELPSYSVTNDRGFVPQDEQFENGGTMREADKTSYWIVEPKSFAYNPARINVGSIGYQSTSRNVIVSSLYEVFQADETCDNRFLWHWFKTRLFTQQIEMLQEGGVRLYFFFDKLLKSGISMPSVDEQRLIGEQFDRIDYLITLHQRKLDLLKNTKKSLLDKMFV